jgi:hypothetical protein
MAYELHIEKKSGEISFNEWIDAVLQIDGAALDGNPSVGKNPKTGEIITSGGNPNNVAVRFIKPKLFGLSKKEEWVTCIYYRKGRASFKATEDIDDIDNPIRIVATSIAKLTGAKVVGDEGELYDW